MKYYQQLPIWRHANQLLLYTEQVVRRFSRYHKYTIGSELRRLTSRICQTIHRAVSRKNSFKLLIQLSELIDDLKFQIQLAKELTAFASFHQFQQMVEQVVQLGRQAGGWLKQVRAELPTAHR
jgi:hypothetical protein